tara:strand:+ start:72 stop:794 length:723 start_codon:yes stop_codon:yes gene_type:complete
MTTWRQLYPIKTVAGGGTAFTDTFSLEFNLADSAATATEAASFEVALATEDNALAATETATLGISGAGNNDEANAATETNSVALKVWLSGSSGTGVTNPSNANGENNGTVARLQTAAAGANPIIMTSVLGANVPSFTVTSAVYRGWFRSATTLATSLTTIVMESITAEFADITMFSHRATSSTIDNLDGSFTFDLTAAGVDTLAKLQSCRVIHRTQDAASGVTPASLTVDASAIEITGGF